LERLRPRLPVQRGDVLLVMPPVRKGGFKTYWPPLRLLVFIVLSLGFKDALADEIGEVQVFLTPTEAIREIFEGMATVDTIQTELSTEEIERISTEIGQFSADSSLVVLVPRGENGDTLGYAVIDEEIGKYRPITFMVGTHPDLSIRGVEILVYRESRGGEVRRQRFLRQYRGKKTENPIQLNRDILNIAGATLSVRALNHGIKRVLASLTMVAARQHRQLEQRVDP